MAQESPQERTNRLIMEAATGTRALSPREWEDVLPIVSQAGFAPAPLSRAGGRLAGMLWQGKTLRGQDRLPSAEVHYLRHVIAKEEWPRGTSLADYLASISRVIVDPSSSILTSIYQGAWQLTLMRRSEELRGPAGSAWILIDYRVTLGHWVTAYQPEAELDELQGPDRSNLRWHRRSS